MTRLRPSVVELLDEKYSFRSYFDRDTGFYARTGVLDENGVDTGVDPFMASFPQLLDIGIMGHCVHGLSGRCAATGIQCYQSGGVREQLNMRFQDFRRIADESSGRVFQFALGGRGDPELHEHFEQILAHSREKSIVPNLTTSGFMLTKEHAQIMRKYCGAVAVSWYKTPYTRRAIDMLLEAGVKTNIHFVLGRDSIDEATDILENDRVPAGINRVIFLLFKPVGQGSERNVLLPDAKTRRLFGLLDSPAGLKSGGFDSCCVPAVVNYTKVMDRNCFDSCEGARYSAYITPDMRILPCSFDQEMRWAYDISTATIAEAWESEPFADFRGRLRSACPECPGRPLCMGGCPIRPEIVLCEKKPGYHTLSEPANRV